MAGDWIKMRTDLAEDPAVIAMADRLGIDEFSVVGRLHGFWSWLDRQSRDGQATGVSHGWLDRRVRCDGFAAALVSVGWLVLRDDGLSVPNFERHNGETAKTRAEATNRKRRQRASERPATVSRDSRDGSATREEKRREEEENPPVVPPQAGGDAKAEKKALRESDRRSAKDKVEGFVVESEHRQWAAVNAPHVDLDSQTERWRDHLRANGYRTRAGLVKDATASWRNWMANSERWMGGRSKLAVVPYSEPQSSRLTRDDVAEVRDGLRYGWTRTDATEAQAHAWIEYLKTDCGGDLTKATTLAEFAAQHQEISA